VVYAACGAQGFHIAIGCTSCLQVLNGKRMLETQKLRRLGVRDGAMLVMLRKRPEPERRNAPPTAPTLDNIERFVRAEAARQGREVTTASTNMRPRDTAPFESRLQDIMQVCPQPPIFLLKWAYKRAVIENDAAIEEVYRWVPVSAGPAEHERIKFE
jgi:hypothetical protein